ncbi:uncharacterized protein LOC141737260 isoform X2 [Larus michahellis]|uniref:uncharacterized protein LOC141737260 isoform X2 n=1 Tax=Larus michahellis TaxID=119627 RepID=UPI003D9B9274
MGPGGATTIRGPGRCHHHPGGATGDGPVEVPPPSMVLGGATTQEVPPGMVLGGATTIRGPGRCHHHPWSREVPPPPRRCHQGWAHGGATTIHGPGRCHHPGGATRDGLGRCHHHPWSREVPPGMVPWRCHHQPVALGGASVAGPMEARPPSPPSPPSAGAPSAPPRHGQQRHQQDGPSLHELPGLHRQPQHAGGEEERRGGHLLQVRQDRGLLRPQGLRLRPVRQRAQRPGGGGRRRRAHDRRAGLGYQPGGRAQGEPGQGGGEALGGRDVRIVLRPGLRLPEGLLRPHVQLPGARAPAAPHRPRRRPLQAPARLGQHLAARQERLQLQERPARLLLQVRQAEGRRPAEHQEGAGADQAEGGRAAGEPGEDREGAEAEGGEGGGGVGGRLGQEGGRGRRGQGGGGGRGLGRGGRPAGRRGGRGAGGRPAGVAEGGREGGGGGGGRPRQRQRGGRSLSPTPCPTPRPTPCPTPAVLVLS